MGEGFVVLQSGEAELTYRQDEPGISFVYSFEKQWYAVIELHSYLIHGNVRYLGHLSSDQKCLTSFNK